MKEFTQQIVENSDFKKIELPPSMFKFEKMRIFSKEQHKVRRELEARLDNLNPFWKRWVAVLEEL